MIQNRIFQVEYEYQRGYWDAWFVKDICFNQNSICSITLLADKISWCEYVACQ